MNPYEPEVDWFTRDVEIHPINDAPEPKRRFAPSQWEEKKCAGVPSSLQCRVSLPSSATISSVPLISALLAF